MLQQPKYEILGIGSACIDLLVHTTDDFLQQLPGNKGGAEPIKWEALEKILEQSSRLPLMRIGGSCANVMKCLAGLHESCGFLSCIGKDEFGNFFVENLKNQNICEILSTSDLPTTCVVCLITPDGQRTMRFVEGCSQSLSIDLLAPEHFKSIKILHIEAYTLRRPGFTEKSMQLAKDNHALVSIDLSSFEVVQQHSRTLHYLLENYVDILFANADEAKALTGLPPKAACFELQKLCSAAVVMIGKEGCFAGQNGQIFHCPAYPAKSIDTTGAGDFFAGGFLFGYLRKKPVQVCADWGNKLGKFVVEVWGAELPPEKWQVLRSQLH